MRRTEGLQETRKMRFEEAYEGWQARRLTQEEAARLLGVCERTFRRYLDRYEEAGLEGLIDKRLEQVSQRRAPVVHAYMPLWLARVAENTLDIRYIALIILICIPVTLRPDLKCQP